MKKIRLFLTGLLLAVTAAAYAQDITVTGTVTDASTGDVIVGASVVLKGSTTEWTMTDDLGQYSLTDSCERQGLHRCGSRAGCPDAG